MSQASQSLSQSPRVSRSQSGSKRHSTSDPNDHTPRRSKRLKEMKRGLRLDELHDALVEPCSHCHIPCSHSHMSTCPLCEKHYCDECASGFTQCNRNGCGAAIGCLDSACHGTDYRCFGCGSKFCSLEHGQLNFCDECDSSSCSVCTNARGHTTCMMCSRRFCPTHASAELKRSHMCDDCSQERNECSHCARQARHAKIQCDGCRSRFCSKECAFEVRHCVPCGKVYCRFCIAKSEEDERSGLGSDDEGEEDEEEEEEEEEDDDDEDGHKCICSTFRRTTRRSLTTFFDRK